MQIDLSEFQDVFFEEAAEHLAGMEQGLLGLEAAGNDRGLSIRTSGVLTDPWHLFRLNTPHP